ncbi:hypothetical protein PGK01_05710 [Acinetobacter baumannii]|nr:hypothetical protein [Acinetobacter baumannii]
MEINKKNYVFLSKDFFKLLKIFYEDRGVEQKKCENFLYNDTIELFSNLEELIHVLDTEGANILSRFEHSGRSNIVIERALWALDKLGTFPDLEKFNKHTKLYNVFFNHFLWGMRAGPHMGERTVRNEEKVDKNQIQTKKSGPERRQQSITLLKRYAVYLRDNKIRGRSHEPKFLDRLNEIEQTWKSDIQELTNHLGLLYAFGMRIRINHKFETSDPWFRKLFLNRYRHLECFQNIPEIVYTICKPMVGVGNSLEYFVIVLINHDDKVVFEEFVIQSDLEKLLKKYLELLYPDTTIQVSNFNSDLIRTFPGKYRGKRWLSNFSASENSNVWNGLLGFMLELEKYQRISDKFLGMIGDRSYLTQNGYPSHIHSMKNIKTEPLKKYYLLKLSAIERNKLIWKTEHLSVNAQDYFANLSILNKEYLTQARKSSFAELIDQIESFMLGIKEAPVSAFGNYDRQIRGRYHQSLEDSATRPLLQFIQLLLKHEKILEFKRLSSPLLSSRLLNHFLYVYDRKQLSLERVLGLDVTKTANRKVINDLIHDFIYPYDVFLKKLLQVDSERGQSTEIEQLIRIPLHKTRLLKVKNYLNQAMKGDVIVIRCQFSCETNRIHLKQKAMSTLFYQMMHAGKRRKPLSAITAYLGFWEWSTKNDVADKLTANVYFIFKSSILNDFPDIYWEMEAAWKNTLNKHAQIYESESNIRFNYQAEFAKKVLINSIDDFATEQVIIENINRKLKKQFIDYISSLVVYRDLLDDDFYATTPKWLIRGTEPRKTKAKKMNKMKVIKKVSKSKENQTVNFYEIASDNLT